MKRPILQILPLLVIGFGAGTLNGLLGTGGGILILLGLSRMSGARVRDPRVIYATALAVTLPLSLFSAFWYFRECGVDASAVAPLLLPAAVGGAVGAFLLRRFSPKLLKRLFAALLLISGVMML